MSSHYPHCSYMARPVRVGGMRKHALLDALEVQHVALNPAARALFADPRFTIAEVSSVIETIELSVAALGFCDGGTSAQLFERALELGLSPCPLELGPHLRLQWLDQPEGSVGGAPTQHRAPPGSVTVASRALSDETDVPKGFYLRKIEGVLWLRGYWSDDENVWNPDDRFVFMSLQDTNRSA